MNAFDKAEIDSYLLKIKDCLPTGYKVLLVAYYEDRPKSWIAIGDLSLSEASQAIDAAMEVELKEEL